MKDEHEMYGVDIREHEEDGEIETDSSEKEFDEMKRRLKEMEEEAAALKEMLPRLLKEMLPRLLRKCRSPSLRTLQRIRRANKKWIPVLFLLETLITRALQKKCSSIFNPAEL